MGKQQTPWNSRREGFQDSSVFVFVFWDKKAKKKNHKQEGKLKTEDDGSMIFSFARPNWRDV